MKNHEDRFKAASCEGKVPFETFTLANKAAKRRKGRAAYHCRFCGRWHAGVSAPDKKKGE